MMDGHLAPQPKHGEGRGGGRWNGNIVNGCVCLVAFLGILAVGAYSIPRHTGMHAYVHAYSGGPPADALPPGGPGGVARAILRTPSNAALGIPAPAPEGGVSTGGVSLEEQSGLSGADPAPERGVPFQGYHRGAGPPLEYARVEDLPRSPQEGATPSKGRVLRNMAPMLVGMRDQPKSRDGPRKTRAFQAYQGRGGHATLDLATQEDLPPLAKQRGASSLWGWGKGDKKEQGAARKIIATKNEAKKSASQKETPKRTHNHLRQYHNARSVKDDQQGKESKKVWGKAKAAVVPGEKSSKKGSKAAVTGKFKKKGRKATKAFGSGGCPAGCTAHGNCNEQTRRCECKLGWGGEDCSKNLLPACDLPLGRHKQLDLACAVHDYRTCDCAVQCAEVLGELGIIRFLTGFCYDLTTPAEKKALIDDPASVKGKMKNFVHAPDRTPPYTMDDGAASGHFVSHHRPLELAPLDDCPERCNGNGVCTSRGCVCVGLRRWIDGMSCGFRSGSANKGFCPVGCSGRGVCKNGFCHCVPGYWGMDCSHSTGPGGKPQLWDGHNADPNDIRIFVYDFGATGHHLVMQGVVEHQGHGEEGKTGDYGRHTEIGLRERIMASRFRTLDPLEADFFYIPNQNSWISWPVVREVMTRWGHFNRTGGRGHLYFSSQDYGMFETFRDWPTSLEKAYPEEPAVNIPALMKEVVLMQVLMKEVVFMQHMGQAVGTKSRGHSGFRGCHRPDHDIVVPPPQTISHNEVAAQVPYVNKLLPKEKKSLVFFAGETFLKARAEDNVRKAVHDALVGSSRAADVVFHAMGTTREGYLRGMREATFCLGLPGKAGGWGRRSTFCALFGSVPVEVQDNRAFAFSTLFAPVSIAVNVPEEKIPQIEEIMRSIPQKEVEFKKKNLDCVWQAWLWGSIFGASGDEETGDMDTFGVLVEELRRRKEKSGFWAEQPGIGGHPPLPDACAVMDQIRKRPKGDRRFADQGRVLPKNSDLRKLDEPRMQEWAERVRAGGRAMKGAVFNINGDLFPGGAACVGLDPPGPPC